MNLNYTAQDFTATISTEEYINRFRDADRFMECCRQCSNYNKMWACPPFTHNLENEMRGYSNILLVATKITPESAEVPLSEALRFIRPERMRIEKRLLEMEKTYGGRSFAFAGTCLYCAPDTCTRLRGLPCRHPDLVRPSLESYGFDIGRTATELFGIDLQWSRNAFLPPYLTLVCAFFHNDPSLTPEYFHMNS